MSTTSGTTQQLRVLQIACGAMLASVGIYGLALPVMQLEAAKPVPQFLVAAVSGLAVLTLVASAFVPKAMTGGRTDDFRAYFVATLVAFALREACAVYGLFLAILAARPILYPLFAVPAAAAMLLGWPRRFRLEN